MSPLDVLGPAEVADLLGVDRNRAYRITKRADFPSPCSVVSGRRVWYGPDVRAWIREHRPSGNPLTRR